MVHLLFKQNVLIFMQIVDNRDPLTSNIKEQILLSSCPHTFLIKVLSTLLGRSYSNNYQENSPWVIILNSHDLRRRI